MKALLVLCLLVSNIVAQENFGIKEKVNTFTENKIRHLLVKEFMSRLEKFKDLENNPKKYYKSLGLHPVEEKYLFKIFPKAAEAKLPKMTLSKTGEIRLTYNKQVAHFTLKDLKDRQVHIDGKTIKLPKRDFENFVDYYTEFNINVYDAFNKKTTRFNFLKTLHLIDSVHADEGSDYLNLPDWEEVPQYQRQGWDKNDATPNLYSDMEKKIERKFGKKAALAIRHNYRQTKQVLLASVMALAGDLELEEMANYDNKKVNLPKNLKKLYKHIDKIANVCDKERIETNGKFRNGSDATKMLTALDLVNEKINRLSSMGKAWWLEVDNLVWGRTSFHPNPDGKSYNICLVKRIQQIYYDKNLCSNMEKLTKCLVDFRTSGRVSENYLSDEQMDLLLENPLGKDYGQEDVLQWIQEK